MTRTAPAPSTTSTHPSPKATRFRLSARSWCRSRRGADALAARPDPVGVHVPGDTDPATLAPLLGEVSLIAIDFPKFTDGRGYSLARMLREEHGYAGELRAVGDVLRDQLFYMARVGFDSFALKDGKSVEDAIAAFADFSDKYQPAADGVPAGWRRG